MPGTKLSTSCVYLEACQKQHSELKKLSLPHSLQPYKHPTWARGLLNSCPCCQLQLQTSTACISIPNWGVSHDLWSAHKTHQFWTSHITLVIAGLWILLLNNVLMHVECQCLQRRQGERERGEGGALTDTSAPIKSAQEWTSISSEVSDLHESSIPHVHSLWQAPSSVSSLQYLQRVESVYVTQM